jgi:hypothetical protein
MPLTALGGASGTVVIGDEATGFFPEVLHPNVQAYVGAQASVGYIMSVNEIDAVNNLVWAMVASGIWDKMEIVYPCIGNNANSFKWNLKDTTTFNITFLGSWVFASTGMQIAAANTANRGATGYTPSVNQTLGSAHISVYIRNFYTSGTTGGIFGAYAQFSGFGTLIGASTSLAGSADGWVQNSGSTSGRVSLSGYSGGMLIASRTTSNVVAINTLNGGIASAAINAWSNSRVTLQVHIGCTFGGTGSLQICQPQEIAFASLGLGLTRIDIKNFYLIVQAFQTKLGRQV